ncbi:ribonuclease HII [Alloscardovia macacae]|uniref:Ribonuclease n=1 Tax=Alloscardovia macacae TaxID=1160091 RepID=A0A1Y2SZJ8_9BIFI|nr:ribonuclease HII [Alloscardovia macacae]OTA29437.1 ribonuclease HII [Alloscardovia macacae]
MPNWELETELVAAGAQWILGLDEVGRGCLAGPVTLGAAAFRAEDIGSDIPSDLKDSKQLSPKRRETLMEPLDSFARTLAVGECTNEEIDEWGISACLGIAALKAIHTVAEELAIEEATIILDGPHDYITPALSMLDAPELSFTPRVVTRIKADSSCASVAAASVYAKVTRDRQMDELAAAHPEWSAYGWAKNKGYGTAQHRAAIRENGVTPYHRLTWHLT